MAGTKSSGNAKAGASSAKGKSAAKSRTPLMGQYDQIKRKHPDALLLFRVGDFYETFGSDAIKAAGVLGIVLTKRANGSASAIELAGFPYHAIDTYLPKLIKAGIRVAICEQLEDPKKTKQLVKRGVTELITPGLAVNEKILEHRQNNFLAAVYQGNTNSGIALLDVSTGEFLVSSGPVNQIDQLIERFNPSEIILAKSLLSNTRNRLSDRYYLYPLEDWIFDPEFGRDKLLAHFEVANLKGFGIAKDDAVHAAAGAIIHYLSQTQHNKLTHLTGISRIAPNDHMWLDRFTIRNLEIFAPSHPDGSALSDILDHTHSPMGARMLRHWLAFPLLDKEKIDARLNSVEWFGKNTVIAEQLDQYLKTLGDLERLLSRIAMGKSSPRGLGQLRISLDSISSIGQLLADCSQDSILKMLGILNPLPELKTYLETHLEDELPVALGKGAVIRTGINIELDELRDIGANGRQFLAELQKKESERTGISSLKVGFNNVFGYYLEVTNRFKDKVPEEWIRKQTLVNAERYITEELKVYEEKILGADEKINALEFQLFSDVLINVLKEIEPLQQNARILAELDVLSCFSGNAIRYNYSKPVVHTEEKIAISAGRHPVIEQLLDAGEEYVPNDIRIDNSTEQILIITGPNMSGKSAMLRQTALITLMAQIGSWVPAEAASIGIIDKLFTRVGASDNISSGESTFMVEMQETASIVNNISDRSLILLDEIGRGTSTYDGISIAWSLVEYLHDNGKAKPKTLFATHYHELSELEGRLPRVKNYHVTTKESGNKVIFLRKIAPGGTHHSFGIHVARMAGMPSSLISRAREVLVDLEQKSVRSNSITQASEPSPSFNSLDVPVDMVGPSPYQLSIFQVDDPNLTKMKEMLEELDIDHLSPVEALVKLNELKSLIKKSAVNTNS